MSNMKDLLKVSGDHVCSPSRKKYIKKTGTCFNNSDFNKIKDAYLAIKPGKNVSIEEINNTLESCDKNKACDVNIESFKEKIRHIFSNQHIFKPKKPYIWYVNKTEWLSNIDIDNVMEQYKSKEFEYLGTHPIDFADVYNNQCISPEICNANNVIKSLKERNVNSFGIIFNLDKHNQSGSHWVALYCNINPKSKMYGVFYYDSVAKPPQSSIKKFMKQICRVVNDESFSCKKNNIRKQFKNSECGMFSLIFLILCIENNKTTTLKKLCKAIDYDDNVNEMRNVLFTSFK